MLVFARKVHHLCHFCFGHFVSEDAALSDAMMMHMQHDSRRRFSVLVEKALEYVDHEFHRRVVVIQDQDTIEVRLLGLWLGARDNRAARCSVPTAATAAVIVRSARPQVTRGSRFVRRRSFLPATHGLAAHRSDSAGTTKWCRKRRPNETANFVSPSPHVSFPPAQVVKAETGTKPIHSLQNL